MKLLSHSLKNLPIAAAFTLAAALSPVTVNAQPPVAAPSSAQSTEAAETQKQIADLRQQINQLSMSLRDIQQRALNANSGLEAQRMAYIVQVDKAVIARGVDVNTIRQRLMWIAEQSKLNELPAAEMAQLSKEYQEKIRQLNNAETEAMKEPEISQAQQALNKAMISAMTEEDANTPKMVAELESVQNQYKEVMDKWMRSQLKKTMAPPQ